MFPLFSKLAEWRSRWNRWIAVPCSVAAGILLGSIAAQALDRARVLDRAEALAGAPAVPPPASSAQAVAVAGTREEAAAAPVFDDPKPERPRAPRPRRLRPRPVLSHFKELRDLPVRYRTQEDEIIEMEREAARADREAAKAREAEESAEPAPEPEPASPAEPEKPQ